MVFVALICLIISFCLGTYRVIAGPTVGDRIAAFDFLAVNLALLIVVVALQTGYSSLLDVALLVSILGFLGTVALARYLLTGRVMK